MKKTFFIIALLLGCVVTSTAQKPSLELTFTAIDSATHIQLDSIKVMNRSQGGDTILYYPDTVLVLDYITGIEEVHGKDNGLKVYQNYPNPVVGSTTITIFVPEKEEVQCMVVNIMGRKLIQHKQELSPGYHSYSFTPGDGDISFFTVQTKDSRESIKIMHPNIKKRSSTSLSYIGMSSAPEREKYTTKALQGFPFELGDKLMYVGYVDSLESGFMDIPDISRTYTFQFAYNIPCPEAPTVTYEGQVYNTVQIFSQCWLKENLNVGIMIPGSDEMSNNGVIEKYCYNDVEDSCSKYGGLYQWDEMMQYSPQQGVQGICPPGWHVPTHEEWKMLEGAVDSYYGIGDTIWDRLEWRGVDAGNNLKHTAFLVPAGWIQDRFGFSLFLCGHRSVNGSFARFNVDSETWTSTQSGGNAYKRSMHVKSSGSNVRKVSKKYGDSVRCIKD